MIRFLSKLRRGGAATATVADARPRGGVRLLGAGAVSLALALGVAACGGSSSASGGDGSGGTVSVVGYSTPQELYEEDAEPAFNQTPDGEGVTFKNSFGASGDQSRAVEAGLPADIMHFALAPDMDRVVEAGLVDATTGTAASTRGSSRTRSSSSSSARATRTTSPPGTMW